MILGYHAWEHEKICENLPVKEKPCTLSKRNFACLANMGNTVNGATDNSAASFFAPVQTTSSMQGNASAFLFLCKGEGAGTAMCKINNILPPGSDVQYNIINSNNVNSGAQDIYNVQISDKSGNVYNCVKSSTEGNSVSSSYDGQWYCYPASVAGQNQTNDAACANQGINNQGTYGNQGAYGNQSNLNNQGAYGNQGVNNQGAYGNQGIATGAYNQNTNNQGAYGNQSVNNQGAYGNQSVNNQGAYNQSVNNQGAYNQGINNQGTYNQGINNQGAYNQGINNQNNTNTPYNQGINNQGVAPNIPYNQSINSPITNTGTSSLNNTPPTTTNKNGVILVGFVLFFAAILLLVAIFFIPASSHEEHVEVVKQHEYIRHARPAATTMPDLPRLDAEDTMEDF